MLVIKRNFNSGGRGGGKPYVCRISNSAFIHTTTDFNPPYMIGVRVGLKLNQRFSIQCTINYGVVSHNSVLCCISKDGMIRVLENGALTAITSFYEALLMNFYPDKVDIDSGISTIIADNPLIKVHP